MAEFDFYCTRDEWVPILNAILKENHLRFVLDEWYRTPYAPVFSDVEHSAEAISPIKRRIFLAGEFTTRELYFSRQPEGDRAGWYSIDISRLGPLMDFSFPGWFLEDGVRRIGNGNLHHPSEYWNSDLTECVKASEAVRAAYAGIKRTLKKWIKRVDFPVPIWVSPAALELSQSCEATLLVNGDWVCGPPGQLSIQRRPQVNDKRRPEPGVVP